MASIRKRTSKGGLTSYRVEIRLKGFPRQSGTFKRLTDAKKWAQITEAAIREGRYFKTAEARKHTFAELVERYILEILPSKPKQQKTQQAQLKWWKRQMGDYLLADITPALITEQRDKLRIGTTTQGKQRSPATVNRYLAAISHAFTIAVNDWGWLDDSPMRKVSKSTEARGRVRFLSNDEVKNGITIDGELSRLLKSCKKSTNPYLYPVVVLAISTGMRQGEIMGLTWDNVDTHAKRITLYETKNGEIRVVPLLEEALEVVEKHPKRLDTRLLFPSKKDPSRPQDLRNPWEKAVKDAAVTDFRFHDLRHTAASYFAMDGASLADIAEVLGHKTLQMVKRYAHLSEAHTTGVVSSMNKKIFR